LSEERRIEYHLYDPRQIARSFTIKYKLREGESLFDVLKNVDSCAIKFLKETPPLDFSVPETELPPAKFTPASQHPQFKPAEQTNITQGQSIHDPKAILESQKWQRSNTNPQREWIRSSELPREILEFLMPAEDQSKYTTLGDYRYAIEGEGYVGRYKIPERR